MRNYATQMEAAKKGIVTPEMQKVAEKEYLSAEEIRGLVAKGQVVICANKLHKCILPKGVGSMLSTKINVNLGVSRDCKDYNDEILDICRQYDVTISLGDACRPGCLADAGDVCQIEELVRLGELTKRAWDKNVQVMVEGPGHMPLDQIEANMKLQQTICMGAPFYVLGPIVTDIAPGYDHITSAIGGAIAASAGAAFLCYVTPAEHLALPNIEDVKQGIIASKIAAHAADIAKKIPHAKDNDDKMADARKTFNWDEQWKYAIDSETAKKIRDERKPEIEESCSMCGKFCAVRNMNKALLGEQIDIL